MSRLDVREDGVWMIEEEGEWFYSTIEDYYKPKEPVVETDPQQAAMDALMLGMIDLYSQQQQSEDKRVQESDAVMLGMMDLYKQIEELKNKIGGTA